MNASMVVITHLVSIQMKAHKSVLPEPDFSDQKNRFKGEENTYYFL